jgi:hypothetical protein
MLKKIFCYLALILSWQLQAMDHDNDVHAPQFKAEVLKFINTQIQRESTSLEEDVAAGAGFGWLLSWQAGAYVAGHCLEALTPHCYKESLSSGSNSIFPGFVFFYSASLLAISLPMGAAGAVGGLCNNLFSGIAVKINKKEFDRHVVLHMYQWISVIKAARLAMRAELEGWLKAHEGSTDSVCEAVTALLQGEKFTQYFGNLNFEREKMINLLGQVGTQNDHLNTMFARLSELVKISDLSESEWIQLEDALVNFKDKTDFPKLSAEDIKTYLYASVYYFTLANHEKNCGVSWLKSLINKN